MAFAASCSSISCQAAYPSALQKGLRSEQALKLALAEMYVQGVSTCRVAAIVEQLCGTAVSSTQVSECTRLLDTELQKWRGRPLGEFPYLILDARYEKVRQDGQLRDCAVLIALGVHPDGKRRILGVSVALSEAEVQWRSFMQGLVQRGLCGVQFITSDDHVGLQAVRTAVFPSVPWQRCQFHLQQNAQAYVPRLDQRAEIGQAIRIFLTALTAPPPNNNSNNSSRATPPVRPNWPLGWKKICRKASPSSPCRWLTRKSCARPMRWNA